jgi:hypothetical protein
MVVEKGWAVEEQSRALLVKNAPKARNRQNGSSMIFL